MAVHKLPTGTSNRAKYPPPCISCLTKRCYVLYSLATYLYRGIVMRRVVRVVLTVAALGVPVGLAACGTVNTPTKTPNSTMTLTPQCTAGAEKCFAQKQARLKSMIADKQNKWVFEQSSHGKNTSGLRLMAYQATIKQLNCRQLALGKSESAAARKAFSKQIAADRSAKQAPLFKMIAEGVNKGLTREFARVCLSASRSKPGFKNRMPKIVTTGNPPKLS